jgi:hypothetical protein
MRTVIRSYALLLILFCAGAVLGAEPAPNTAQLSWTAPTQDTYGQTLTKCATQNSTGSCLRSFRAYHGTSEAEVRAKTDGRTINNRNATSYEWTNLAPGTHYFAVTAVNGDGGESDLSQIGTKAVPPPVPLPPGNFTVQQDDTTAYYVIQQENRFVLLPAGTVQPGTQCDASQQVNGHYVVPRTAVEWFGDVRPLAVVARCG